MESQKKTLDLPHPPESSLTDHLHFCFEREQRAGNLQMQNSGPLSARSGSKLKVKTE